MKLALLVVSFIVAALLAEVMVLLIAGEQPKFPRHVVEAPWGLRYNQPNKTYRHKSADMTAWFTINAQGMRENHDIAYAKPPEVKRVISLGDSFTIGYEVDEDATFSSVIERELNSRGIKAEVLNCGVAGYSNAEELVYLEKELLKYNPDLVIVSFCGNDLVDNIRTGLYRLDDGQLVAMNDRYVPAGGLANFLNTNWFFNALSAHSNAFVLVKEQLSIIAKRQIVAANEQNMRDAETKPQAKPGTSTPPAVNEPSKKDDYQKLLCAAIFERMYMICQSHNIPLLIHSIPMGGGTLQNPMREMFPTDYFDVYRPGIYYFASKEVLDPHQAKQQLYWQRSHVHWTPFSHDLAGRAMAELILANNLLR
jgi:hypothetical protein